MIFSSKAVQFRQVQILSWELSNLNMGCTIYCNVKVK